MYNVGNTKLVLYDNLDGWGREGCGRGIQEGGVHVYAYGWFTVMYGRSYHNIIKLTILQLKYFLIGLHMANHVQVLAQQGKNSFIGQKRKLGGQ